jgi:hypothetical protein
MVLSSAGTASDGDQAPSTLCQALEARGTGRVLPDQGRRWPHPRLRQVRGRADATSPRACPRTTPGGWPSKSYACPSWSGLPRGLIPAKRRGAESQNLGQRSQDIPVTFLGCVRFLRSRTNMRILFLTNIELARWRAEMIRLIAFALVAATTPAFAQNYQPTTPMRRSTITMHRVCMRLAVRALIPDPAAIRTGRAMSMPRLDSQFPPATGLPSASGTVMRGAFATLASAADRASVSVISLTARLQRKTPGPEGRNREEEG